jgi:hypothetical protein
MPEVWNLSVEEAKSAGPFVIAEQGFKSGEAKIAFIRGPH